MKLLPLFKEETTAGYSRAISLVGNTGYFSAEDAERISGYMESCVVIESWLSNIRDVVSKEYCIPAKTWSDGAFAWDSSHIHYLKIYRARLPDEFVNHVRLQISLGPKAKEEKEILHSRYQDTIRKLMDGNEDFFAGYANPCAPATAEQQPP